MIEPVIKLQIQVGRQKTQTSFSYQRATLRDRLVWADGTSQCLGIAGLS